MQTQVAEYKQLKDTLNRIPSFRKADPAERPSVTQVAHSPQGDNTARENAAREPQQVRGWWPTVRSLSLSSCHQANCFSCRTTVLKFQRISESPTGLSKQQLLGPSSGFPIQLIWGEAWGFAFLIQLVWGAHSENDCSILWERHSGFVLIHRPLFVWKELWCPEMF